MQFARELTDHGWRTRCKHPVVRSIKSHAGSDAEPVTSLEISLHCQYTDREIMGRGGMAGCVRKGSCSCSIRSCSRGRLRAK